VALPHLVEMHDKYAKDGLVVMTVDIDDDAAEQSKAAAFLKEKKAVFPNWVIAPGEPRDDWEKKFKLEVFPSSYLYDREGKAVQHFEGAEPKEIEDKVKEQLSKK
jgi:hypothetical protein